jgi:hypothetical protein
VILTPISLAKLRADSFNREFYARDLYRSR